MVGLWSQDEGGRPGRDRLCTVTMGSKPQNIYLFQLNDFIKWTPAMFLAWITVLRGTHKWSTVTPSCSLMYQIQCLPRVQRLSQMWKLFVLVNKLNFTATLSFYHATGILREVVAAWAGSQCYTEAYQRPRDGVSLEAYHPCTRCWMDQWSFLSGLGEPDFSIIMHLQGRPVLGPGFRGLCCLVLSHGSRGSVFGDEMWKTKETVVIWLQTHSPSPLRKKCFLILEEPTCTNYLLLTTPRRELRPYNI